MSTNGFNSSAIVALLLGILPNIPGFLVVIGAVPARAVWLWLVAVYSYAWFVGFFLAGAAYRLLMRRQPKAAVAAPVAEYQRVRLG